MDDRDALAAFAALSQQTRLDVFRLLVRAGPEGMRSGELGEALGVRQNTMSANLAILLNAGLVKNERHGRTIRYAADLDAIRRLLRFLMQDCCDGRPELCGPALEAIFGAAGAATSGEASKREPRPGAGPITEQRQ